MGQAATRNISKGISSTSSTDEEFEVIDSAQCTQLEVTQPVPTLSRQLLQHNYASSSEDEAADWHRQSIQVSSRYHTLDKGFDGSSYTDSQLDSDSVLEEPDCQPPQYTHRDELGGYDTTGLSYNVAQSQDCTSLETSRGKSLKLSSINMVDSDVYQVSFTGMEIYSCEEEQQSHSTTAGHCEELEKTSLEEKRHIYKNSVDVDSLLGGCDLPQQSAAHRHESPNISTDVYSVSFAGMGIYSCESEQQYPSSVTLESESSLQQPNDSCVDGVVINGIEGDTDFTLDSVDPYLSATHQTTSPDCDVYNVSLIGMGIYSPADSKSRSVELDQQTSIQSGDGFGQTHGTSDVHTDTSTSSSSAGDANMSQKKLCADCEVYYVPFTGMFSCDTEAFTSDIPAPDVVTVDCKN